MSCTGYRKPNQLRVRDETEKTKRRALSMKPQLIVPFPPAPLDQLARAAFFSHYVNGFSHTYDVLDRMGFLGAFDNHLAASVDAVSLAFFSFHFDAPTAIIPAKTSYLAALPLIKTALVAPKSVVSNSTLLAVLFLDLFEKLIDRSPVSSEAWMSHVRGAMALVKMREPDQLKTYVGRRLAARLFTNMLISCLAANAPLPLAMKRLHSDLELCVDTNDPKWQVSTLAMVYANFRGALQDGLLSPAEIVAGAKSLDNRFSSLATSLPASWTSRRILVQTPSPRVFEGYYDVYPDHFTTQTSNVIRHMRILLNSLIRTVYLSDMSPCTDDGIRKTNAAFAAHIMNTMAKEVCATGPQFTLELEDTNKRGISAPARKLHCHTLLLPFYVAAVSADPETRIRHWVIQQLRYIAAGCAIKNASLIADILERRNDPDPWIVYVMLGSYAFAS